MRPIVANEQLRGKSDIEKAQVVQWLSFADSEIVPASCTWVFPLLGIMPYDKQVEKDFFSSILFFLHRGKSP